MGWRPVGQCQVCERAGLSLVWARYKHFTTTVRAHYPEPGSAYTNRPLPTEWCPGSGRPPKGTP
jgi:hypothetical protein